MKKIIIYISMLSLGLASCDKQDMATTNSNSSTNASNGFSGDNMGAGRGGSLARFTIAGNHLYIVDERKLSTYSLATSDNPLLTSSVEVGSDIETIFAYKDKLFIGSMNAMFIYDISNPATPSRLGTASNVRACDPVVANDSTAYVTVRAGSTCGGNLSALLVYDVRNLMNPVQRASVNMESPYGLGIRDKRLYVCNGSNGLNIYDIANRNNPVLVSKVAGETYYDVIPLDNLLICMVQGGMVLFEYGVGTELERVAKITN